MSLWTNFITIIYLSGLTLLTERLTNYLTNCMERLRWMDQVEEDLKRIEIICWRAKVEDRQEWNRIVEQTKTHPGL